MSAYPYGGSIVVDRAAPPPAPQRGPTGVPGGRDTQLFRDDADSAPPPPPPESSGTPAPAPQPTLSPRDIQPAEPDELQQPSTSDDAAAADAGQDFGQVLGARPTEPAEAPEPGERAAAPEPGAPAAESQTPEEPSEQPAEDAQTPEVDLPAHPEVD